MPRERPKYYKQCGGAIPQNNRWASGNRRLAAALSY